jgi:hypothetical protein
MGHANPSKGLEAFLFGGKGKGKEKEKERIGFVPS